MLFKRCLLGLQKGVSKGLKGHLLHAKRALIESQLTPFLFSRFEVSLQNGAILIRENLLFTLNQLVRTTTNNYSSNLGFLLSKPLPLEAMAFKEVLILIAIAIEDVDIDIATDATHLAIRTQLPVS